MSLIRISDIDKAHSIIKPLITATPLITNEEINAHVMQMFILSLRICNLQVPLK